MDATNTDTTIDEGQSHLAAAEEFFKQSEKPTTPPVTPPVTPPAEKKPITVKSPLEGVVKLPGQEPPKAADDKTGENHDAEFDKKLAELKEPGEKFKPDWDKLKTLTREERKARQDIENKLKAREQELADLRTKSVDMTAIEASKARIAELETQLTSFSEKLKAQDIRQHPDYVREVEAPKGEARKSIETLLATEGVEANVAEILALSGKEFSKAISTVGAELSEFSRTQLYSLVKQFKDFEAKGASIVANSEQYKTAAQQRALAENRRVFQSVQSQFLSDDFIRPQTADEKADDAEKASVAAYNAARMAVAKDAEQIVFGQTSEADMARVAHEAAMYRFLMQHGLPRINSIFTKEATARETELQALRERVAGLEKAGSLDLGGGGGAGGGGDTRVEDMDALAAAKKFGFR